MKARKLSDRDSGWRRRAHGDVGGVFILAMLVWCILSPFLHRIDPALWFATCPIVLLVSLYVLVAIEAPASMIGVAFWQWPKKRTLGLPAWLLHRIGLLLVGSILTAASFWLSGVQSTESAIALFKGAWPLVAMIAFGWIVAFTWLLAFRAHKMGTAIPLTEALP